MTHADVNDRATEVEEQAREDALARIRRAAQNKLHPKGTCHYCEDTVIGTVFCDADCRSMYETEKRLRAQNGR